MQICAIQKLTLLDYPGKVACTVFTKGCNFRCPFCHNASLVCENYPNESSLKKEEIIDFLKKRIGVLDGVAITGGEPLLDDSIIEFLVSVKKLNYKIKLDTNGSNPKLLRQIVSEKLVDKIAMDIKNSPELYSVTIGNDKININDIAESKNFLLEDHIEYEFRTTVVKGLHTKESLIKTAEWIIGAKEYYLQQFKDSGNLICNGKYDSFTSEELLEFAEFIKPLIPSVKVRGI